MSIMYPNTRRNLLTIAVTWLLLYATFALANPPLLDGPDSVHAEIAREMLQRGDAVTLYVNGVRSLENAPLLYWSMAASMHVFGIYATAARIPMALTVLALALVLYFFVRRTFAERAALYAAMAMLTCFGSFLFSRTLVSDAMACLWLSVAMACFWNAEQQQRPALGWCLGFGAACGLNVLTQGPIGLVLPAIVVPVSLFALYPPSAAFKRVWRLHPIATLAAFLLVAVPWHVFAALDDPAHNSPGLALTKNNGWAWLILLKEHFYRSISTHAPHGDQTLPIVLFWALLLVWLMPWSGFLFKAISAVPWSNAMRRRGMDLQGRTRLLLALWAAVPMLFFSFTPRQEICALPALPPLLILIAVWMSDEAQQAEEFAIPASMLSSGRRISVVLLAIGSCAALACLCLLLRAGDPLPGQQLVEVLRQNTIGSAHGFGHVLDLNTASMAFFRGPLWATGIALFCGTLVNWWARSEFKPHFGNTALAAMSFIVLVAVHVALQRFAPVLGSHDLAVAIQREQKPGNLIVLNDDYERGSSLGFYLQRSDIHLLHGHSANLWSEDSFHRVPKIAETDQAMRLKWLRPERIFLWTDPARLPEYCKPAYFVASSGGKEVVSNKSGPY